MKFICINIMLLLFFTNSYAQERVVNYDEDKVGTYTLPKILKTEDHKDVETVRQWERIRRPEILALFENEVYGQMPKKFDKIGFSIVNSDAKAMNGKAYLKEVRIEVFNNNKAIQLYLVLFVPNNVKDPVPAFLLINHRDEYNTDPTRYIKSEFWPAEMVINAGYAIAAFQTDDAAPDNKETYGQGVLELYPKTT